MSAPLIFNGRRAKMLTQDGILRADGSIIDNNGTPNLIKNGHAEINVTGWTVSKNTVAASRPDSGFVTSSTNITWTRNTTNPIDGQADFLYTKDAANRQGEQVYCGFTVAKKYRAKVLQIEVDYLVNSGTFSAGSSSTDSDVILYIYDVTNSTFIEPSSFKFLSNSSTIADKFVANFQTSATGSSYRILFHQATTSTSAFAVQFKDVSIKPCNYVYGTPISDWVSYTPTITGLGTPASQSFYTRRVGDSRQVKFVLVAGTTTAALVSFTLPNNESIDSNKIAASTVIGKFNANATTWNGSIFKGASNSLVYFGADGTAYTSGYNGNNYANGTTFGGYFEVPIQGWSSSVQQSDGYDGRQITFKASTTPGTIATSAGVWTTLTWSSAEYDDVSGFNGTDTYTVRTAGTYELQILASTNAATGSYLDVGYRIDSGSDIIIGRSIGVSGSVSAVTTGTTQVKLNAGQTIQARGQTGDTSGINLRRITLKKLASPQTVSATEVVAAQYNTTGGVTSWGASAVVPYTSKQYDTHNAYNTSTGLFTCPVSGIYTVICQFFGTTNFTYVYLGKNGSSVSSRLVQSNSSGQSASIDIQCNAGDTLGIYNASATVSSVDGAAFNSVSFKRIK